MEDLPKTQWTCYAEAGPPRGGGGQEGELAPVPKQVGVPNLRNILKLNKAPSKSGRVQAITTALKAPLEVVSTLWRTVNRFLVLLFENNDVIGPRIKFCPGPREFSRQPCAEGPYFFINFDQHVWMMSYIEILMSFQTISSINCGL